MIGFKDWNGGLLLYINRCVSLTGVSDYHFVVSEHRVRSLNERVMRMFFMLLGDQSENGREDFKPCFKPSERPCFWVDINPI